MKFATLFVLFALLIPFGFGQESCDFLPLEIGNPSPLDQVVDDASPLRSIQDYWAIYEVSDSMRENYADGEPWNFDAEELLFYQYRLGHLPLDMMEKWYRSQEELVEFDTYNHAVMSEHRFELFLLQGTLTSVKCYEIPSDVAERFQIARYYQCSVTLDGGRKVELFSNHVPRKFQKDGEITGSDAPARVSALAIVMKKGVGNSYYLLADHLSWYPPTPLGKLGMDYACFDDLDRTPLPEGAKRSANRDLRLGYHNRECFYQLMHTVVRITPDELKNVIQTYRKTAPPEAFREGTKYSSVVPLFERPATVRGEFFHLKGVARRIVAVRVEEPDIHSRFGIDHYYEIYLFTDDAPEVPIVILVPELPEGVKPGNEGCYVELSIPAFFFNTWAYKSISKDGKDCTRLVPLLMGTVPRHIPVPQTPNTFWFQMAGLTLFLVLISIAVVFYFLNIRGNRDFQKKVSRHIHGLEEGEKLDGEQWDTTSVPDFNRWAEEQRADEKRAEEPSEQS